MLQTSDEGYIILGGILIPASDTSYMYLVKTDYIGDTLWTKMYGEKYYTWGHSIQQTTDGGYILLGSSTNNKINVTVDSGFMYLVKTNANGEVSWTKYYDNAGGMSVDQTTDGGYILFGDRGWEMYLIKTDMNGDSLWSKTYTSAGYPPGNSVQQTTDGGYILLGNGMTLVKTDSTGTVQWSQYFYYGDGDGKSVQQTTDGGYIACGSQLVKTDSLGDTLWTKKINGNSVRQTTDGGYIITGGNGINIHLIKTDGNGYTKWSKTFGLYDYQGAESVLQTSDGGYVLTGFTSILVGDKKAVLIKTDSTGYAPSFVSISEFSPINKQTILIYPNPTTDDIFIKGSLDVPALLELYDITGRKVLEQTLAGINSRVNISHLSKGFYIYKIRADQSGDFTGKVIKH